MNQQDFYQLYFDLLNYNGDAAYADVLMPWLEVSQDDRTWLRAFGQRVGNPIPPACVEDLWRLYAVSRVFDLLILPFQSAPADADWPGPAITMDELLAFIDALGLTVQTPAQFCPFYHEIVKVEADKSIQGARLTAYQWPCVMLGNMIFLRGGVQVAANSSFLTPGIADSSTLYWTYRRKTRAHHDLSHGWGSNSQWRTDFRRDYLVGNVKYFNVDGCDDLQAESMHAEASALSSDELNLAERIELVSNRCFVTSTKPHEGLFPYDDRFQLSSASG